MPQYYVHDGEDERVWNVERGADGLLTVTDPSGAIHSVDAYSPEPGRLHLLRDGRSCDVDVRTDATGYMVQWRGHVTSVDVVNERQHRLEKAGVGGRKAAGPDLISPMAGKVVAISAAEGDTVVEGQPIVVIEAMKMENDLKAHKDGVISKIHVESGLAVEVGTVLVTIEDE